MKIGPRCSARCAKQARSFARARLPRCPRASRFPDSTEGSPIDPRILEIPERSREALQPNTRGPMAKRSYFCSLIVLALISISAVFSAAQNNSQTQVIRVEVNLVQLN